jgi:hypothetical protein
MNVHTTTSRRIMAGGNELNEFVLLPKLPWFVSVCDSIFTRAYSVTGLQAVE